MKKLLILLLLAELVADAQPKSKQALMQGNGTPIALLNGDTFDRTSYAMHATTLADSVTVIRMGR